MSNVAKLQGSRVEQEHAIVPLEREQKSVGRPGWRLERDAVIVNDHGGAASVRVRRVHIAVLRIGEEACLSPTGSPGFPGRSIHIGVGLLRQQVRGYACTRELSASTAPRRSEDEQYDTRRPQDRRRPCVLEPQAPRASLPCHGGKGDDLDSKVNGSGPSGTSFERRLRSGRPSASRFGSSSFHLEHALDQATGVEEPGFHGLAWPPEVFADADKREVLEVMEREERPIGRRQPVERSLDHVEIGGPTVVRVRRGRAAARPRPAAPRPRSRGRSAAAARGSPCGRC